MINRRGHKLKSLLLILDEDNLYVSILRFSPKRLPGYLVGYINLSMSVNFYCPRLAWYVEPKVCKKREYSVSVTQIVSQRRIQSVREWPFLASGLDKMYPLICVRSTTLS